MTQFRCSTLNLQMDEDKHKKIERYIRICKMRNMNPRERLPFFPGMLILERIQKNYFSKNHCF